MNIALVGTGQMGQAVERVAVERGHNIAARYDENRPLPEGDRPGDLTADVLIDFTLPSLAVEHIRRYCRWGVPAVIGTTGWYGALEEVRVLVADCGGSVLYAPNFSIGVALLVRALEAVAPVLDELPEYDMFVHEWHHVRKVDSPSGTALLLADTLRKGVRRKTHNEVNTQHGRIEPGALHVSSTRVGSVVGKHIVGLDSPFDTLEFTHEAKSRVGFAFGAVKSAEWLPGHKGLFTLEDVLADMLGSGR